MSVNLVASLLGRGLSGAKMPIAAPSESGTRGEYHWFHAQWGYLPDLVQSVPKLVCGRHVAVTSCDAAPFHPSEAETRAGWSVSEDVAYSPKIRKLIELPLNQYDEWYVLPELKSVGKLEVLVTNSCFQLQDPKFLFTEDDSTSDRAEVREAIAFLADYQQRFWQQLTSLSAESYLAEGEALICVTRQSQLVDAVRRYFYETA